MLALFHHIFCVMVEDIATHNIADGCYALEFERQGRFLLMYIRFWKDKQLCRVFLQLTGRSVIPTSYEVSLISHLLGAIPTQTSPVSVNECSEDLVTKLDQSQSHLFKFGISYSIRFEEFSINQLMHKHCYSVFGRIDFFSVLLPS